MSKCDHLGCSVSSFGFFALFVRDGLLVRTKTEDMIAQIHTNLLGTMLTCKAAVKSMIQQQGGAIVNIGKFLV